MLCKLSSQYLYITGFEKSQVLPILCLSNILCMTFVVSFILQFCMILIAGRVIQRAYDDEELDLEENNVELPWYCLVVLFACSDLKE